MKTFKSLIVAAASLAIAGGAFAQTTIKITGSTAYRAGWVAAIVKSINNPTGAFVGGGPINSATQAIITGTLPSNGDTVVFQLVWSGSVAGLNDTSLGNTTISNSGLASTATWISATQTNPANAFTAITATEASNEGFTYTGGTALTNTGGAINFDPAAAPDVVSSDSSSATVAKAGIATATSAQLAAITGVNPHAANPSGISTTDGGVGVIPFVYVKGPAMTGLTGTQATNYAASYARLTNITSEQVQALWINGVEPLSALTGNSADQGVDVIITGRNNDSGTRLGSLAESFVNAGKIGTTYSVFDLNAEQAGGHDTTSITDVSDTDNSGFSSGGKLAAAVNLFPTSAAIASEGGTFGTNGSSGNPFILVTYLGVADAFTVVNPGQTGAGHTQLGNGALLTYNGIGAPITADTGNKDANGNEIFVVDLLNPSTNLGAPIAQAAYTYWEQEHVYFRPGLTSATSGDLETAVNLVFSRLYTTDAIAAGLRYSDLATGDTDFGTTSRSNELSTVLP